MLGEVSGSGYREPPSLVRRADGQVLQLTPVLYAVLAAVDGERTPVAIADHLLEEHRVVVEAADIEHLLEAKLRPLGVLQRADGTEPPVRRSNPLLALRGRLAVLAPATVERLTAPLVALFSPVLVVSVLAAFAGTSGWLLFAKGLASATRQALYAPDLLLVVIALTLASAAFHELGHAAACLRGGARPGAIGMGLYLVWPAFYTDVSDSYRLARPDRLRVDLGGLYFNAVFSVGVFGLWALTGADALLVVVPCQLLQMLRQLVPFVRFDGYHILADLTGVPDLFARIKPTLLSLWPTRWGGGGPSPLKPWARFVITAWVLVVVPVLLFSLVMMVVALPRIVATTWDSVGRQASYLAVHWDEGQITRLVLGAVSITAIALPALSLLYLVGRVVHRTGRRLWRTTDGHPRQRLGLLAGTAALAVALLVAWWPDGQYRPIDRDDTGTVLDGVRAVLDGPTAPVNATSTSAAASAEVDDPRSAAEEAHPEPGADAPAPGASGASAERPRHTFQPPAAPGRGDNQALAVNYDDGSMLTDMASSLLWDDDGVVTSRNQAYALASCSDCTTVAVAFQVVLVVGDADRVGPVNEAVAVNEVCLRCRTAALSTQVVLSLPAPPTAAQTEELEVIWARTDAIEAALASLTPAQVKERLDAVKADIVALFGPGVRELLDRHRTDEAEPTTADTVPSTTTTTTASESAPSTTSPSTTSGEPSGSTATSTTAAPSTTTSTEPAPDPTTSTTGTTAPSG